MRQNWVMSMHHIETIFHLPHAQEQDFFRSDVPVVKLDPKYTRKNLPLPQCAEVDVVRHYVKLSQRNHAVDTGFYPLGSCTMKYNPKINEEMARLSHFALSHPLTPSIAVQGNLQLMYELEQLLKEITGMSAFTLAPAAGAHGEMIGVMILRAYFTKKKEIQQRTTILIPDSAHGTNPASAALCGFSIVEVKSDSRGNVDLDDLKKKLGSHVAALMITNPNTAGLFEENIVQIAQLVHDVGALLYCDGANMNAMVGIVRPADFGVDILHLNLHKTFSTPHGGGGPGAGPVGVSADLVPYLPVPFVRKTSSGFELVETSPDSIGTMRSFSSNFGVLVRAYTYIRSLGQEGLHKMGRLAVLNANYLRKKLEPYFSISYPRVCQHECVFTEIGMPNGITTMDIAKRLLDFGFHAPTIYFPLHLKGAMMIEPTETENKTTLDRFADAMIQIAQEAKENPALLHQAPKTTIVGRLDAVEAARNPIIVETSGLKNV